MASRLTEALHPLAKGLDARPPAELLALMLDGQAAAVAAVAPAFSAIADGAAALVAALSGGGSLAYAGAGSSALMAVADGLELAGTYGVDPSRVRLLMAGGLPVDARMPGDTEDDAAAGSLAAGWMGAGDALVAVTASGATPYALGAAGMARQRGARVIGLANNRDAALFALCDIAICLETPPEIIAGSTRMGAGTAQKVALNLMSTLAGIGLGQVHDGMMVGLVADNAKLRARAAATVATIADVAPRAAEQALARADGAVKPAVLLALGATAPAAAALLGESKGNLRAAMARLAATGGNGRTTSTNQGSSR